MDDTAEPRWLDQDERQAWIALIGMLTRLPGALDAQLQREAGITHFEYQVLVCLSESPEHTLRMSVLAMLVEGSLPRISQVVSRLEKRGLVHRVPDPDDARCILAILTDEGLAKAVQTAPGHVGEVRRLVFDPLTKPQVRQLQQISRRIIGAIDPAGLRHLDRWPDI